LPQLPFLAVVGVVTNNLQGGKRWYFKLYFPTLFPAQQKRGSTSAA